MFSTTVKVGAELLIIVADIDCDNFVEGKSTNEAVKLMSIVLPNFNAEPLKSFFNWKFKDVPLVIPVFLIMEIMNEARRYY